MLPGLRLYGRGYMVHNSYTMCICGLPDMTAEARGPHASILRAKGVHIRQTTHTHGITMTYTHIYIHTLCLTVCISHG